MKFMILVILCCILNANAWASEVIKEQKLAGVLFVEHGGQLVCCPLQHTDIKIEVSGLIARVTVQQRYVNPLDHAIEATYRFPLAHNATIDQMFLEVEGRKIRGLVMRRAEAKRVYDKALQLGKTAALLNQVRPNIFTQNVGNIPAGKEVTITISYVDAVVVDKRSYEIHVPLVVGPRYTPAGYQEDKGESASVKDPASVVTVNPKSLVIDSGVMPSMRDGHKVAISMSVDFGVAIHNLHAPSHQCVVTSGKGNAYALVLQNQKSIPNRDFIARWSVAARADEASLLVHKPSADKPGYFMLHIMPADLKKALAVEDARDFCFLIDVSGSMGGSPTEQVKACMREFLKGMHPGDRIQLHTFAGRAGTLFPSYVSATQANKKRALQFTDGIMAGGGTEMAAGFREVLTSDPDSPRTRYVILLSDGYINNEKEIVKTVTAYTSNKRKFIGLGIGSSVNRYLFDGIKEAGNGLSQVLTLREDVTSGIASIVKRIHQAQFSDIHINWGEMNASQVFPSQIPDYYEGLPIIVYGQFSASGRQQIMLTGRIDGGKDDNKIVRIPVEITIPEQEKRHSAIAGMWARRAIKDLQHQHYRNEVDKNKLVKTVTDLALRYQIMSQYTSFVAIDEEYIKKVLGVDPQHLHIPLSLPDGVALDEEIPYGYAALRHHSSLKQAVR